MNKSGTECEYSETAINNAIISSRLLSSHNISRKELEFCISFFEPVYPAGSICEQLYHGTSETP